MCCTDIVNSQRIYYDHVITEVATVRLRKHFFHNVVWIFNNLKWIHGIYTGTDQRMIQSVDNPEDLICKGVGMVLNSDLHSKFLNKRNGRLKFIITVCHLSHDFRMHTGSIKFSRSPDIQAELHQFCIQIMSHSQCFFYGTVHSGIATCLERRIELQKQPMLLCCFCNFLEVLRSERIFFGSSQKVYLGDLQSVQLPLFCLVHQFIQSHNLIKIIILTKSPALSKAKEMKSISMHSQS